MATPEATEAQEGAPMHRQKEWELEGFSAGCGLGAGSGKRQRSLEGESVSRSPEHPLAPGWRWGCRGGERN